MTELTFQTKEDSKRESMGQNKPKEETWDAFLLQSKLVLLTLHFPKLRIIWSSSPYESVRILSDLKLNHDEPDELTAILKGSTSASASAAGMAIIPEMENTAAVEMLRTIPGVQGHALKYVMSKVESIGELVKLSEKELREMLGEEQGKKAHHFINCDGRRGDKWETEERYADGLGIELD
jgi:DNA excision repair protein ERCC-4